MVRQFTFLLPAAKILFVNHKFGFVNETCVIRIAFHLRRIQRTKKPGLRMNLEQYSFEIGAELLESIRCTVAGC